jgi:catechol 2,3-dioxygenase-like lactoylglutathione lyase family enzyme
MTSVLDKHLPRRSFIFGGIGLTLALPPVLESMVPAQSVTPDAQFPSRVRGWDHLGLTVRDQEQSAKFYGRIFNPDLHGFKLVPPRFFVTLGQGYIAFGGSATAAPRIDHFSPLIQDFGDSTNVNDPDGLQLQLKGTPGGLTENTVPIGRISDEEPVVRPIRIDHIMLVVPDLNRSSAHYRKFLGPEVMQTKNPDRAWFRVGQSRLGLEAAPAGQPPRADHFCVNVSGFNREAAVEKLKRLGADISPSNDEGLLRFRDPNGILVELKAG